MADRNAILREMETLSPQTLQEVFDFICFLRTKDEKRQLTLASEQALAKEWLLPEEDAAWANL